jgi:hypothetical protein
MSGVDGGNSKTNTPYWAATRLYQPLGGLERTKRRVGLMVTDHGAAHPAFRRPKTPSAKANARS